MWIHTVIPHFNSVSTFYMKNKLDHGLLGESAKVDPFVMKSYLSRTFFSSSQRLFLSLPFPSVSHSISVIALEMR